MYWIIEFIRYTLLYRILSYLTMHIDTQAGGNHAYRYTGWSCLFYYNIIISPLQSTKTHGEQLANEKKSFKWAFGVKRRHEF